MIYCFHKWHFLTTACTICLNQIHPRLKWLYGPMVTRSICQGFILIWLRSLLLLDRCMVLFSFYVEVFVENACVCIRLIGPTYVVVLSIWLFAVFTVIMLLGWSSRLSMWIKLILSYLILAIRWLVHWPLMGGLLHMVQRGGAWAGWGPAQSPPRCTKCNSPPINGQCTNFMLFDVAL